MKLVLLSLFIGEETEAPEGYASCQELQRCWVWRSPTGSRWEYSVTGNTSPPLPLLPVIRNPVSTWLWVLHCSSCRSILLCRLYPLIYSFMKWCMVHTLQIKIYELFHNTLLNGSSQLLWDVYRVFGMVSMNLQSSTLSFYLSFSKRAHILSLTRWKNL